MKVLIASIAVLAAASLTAAQSPSITPQAEPKDLPGAPPPPTQAQKDAHRAKLEKAVAGFTVPIEFYGRVVDSREAPVAGLEVPCSITEMVVPPDKLINERIKHPFSVKTDADGKFKIADKRGFMLSVGLANPYLVCMDRTATFSYALGGERYKPDPAKPVRFVLVREEEAGPVQIREFKFSFQWDGKPRRFDLATGKESETGELEITPRRRGYEKSYNFDWCVDVKLHGGKIARGGWDSAGFGHNTVAPVTGYQETVSYGRGYDDRPGLTQPIGSDPAFFLRNSEGKYSRLTLPMDTTNRGQEARGTIYLSSRADGGPVIMEKEKAVQPGK